MQTVIYVKLKIPDQVNFHYHSDGGCKNFVISNRKEKSQALFGGPHLLEVPEELYQNFKEQFQGIYEVITQDEYQQILAKETTKIFQEPGISH